MTKGFLAIFKRELKAYFLTPIGYVFIAAFCAISILFALQIGQLIETGRADLWSFFQFHPWLYLVFVPLLGMRAWSDEIKNHTLDTLLSLPLSIVELVLGKFAAGLCVVLMGLICTFPLWIAVNFLGPIDNGATLASYFGSLLLAGAMLAISNAASALSRNQIISFVIAGLICFVLSALGLPAITQITANFFGASFSNSIADLSLIDRFESIARGYISLSGVIFFITTILFWLTLAVLFIDNRRSAIN